LEDEKINSLNYLWKVERMGLWWPLIRLGFVQF